MTELYRQELRLAVDIAAKLIKEQHLPFNIACCKARDLKGVLLEDIQEGLRIRSRHKRESNHRHKQIGVNTEKRKPYVRI